MYFTVELSRPDGGWSDLERDLASARRASEDLQREGVAVRFVRSIFVPEDDACILLYESAAADDVRRAVELAELDCRRVAQTLRPRDEDGGAPPTATSFERSAG